MALVTKVKEGEAVIFPDHGIAIRLNPRGGFVVDTKQRETIEVRDCATGEVRMSWSKSHDAIAGLKEGG